MPRSLLVRRIVMGMLAGLAFGGVISEVTYFLLRTGESRAPQVIEIEIPPGTAEKIARGLPEPSLPPSMVFVIGDTLLVRNRDSVSHQLGPVFIPAGSSASLELNSAQKYSASCTFQPSRYMGLEVQQPLTLYTRLFGILQTGLPLGLLFVLYGVFALPVRKEVAP